MISSQSSKNTPSTLPLLSIICPCFNAGVLLEGLIENVLAQDYPNKELVIVDGGSTDPETQRILAKYKEQAVILSEKDKGIYDAMNKGVALSKGDWLYFIGADDRLHSQTVLSDVFAGKDYSEKDIIVGACYFGKVLRQYRLYWKMNLENTVLHQAAFYARRVFDNFKYDAAFRVYADYDLNYYCLRHYNRSVHVSTIFADFSLDGISSQINFVSYAEELKVRRKYHNAMVCFCLAPYTYARYSIRKFLSFFSYNYHA